MEPKQILLAKKEQEGRRKIEDNLWNMWKARGKHLYNHLVDHAEHPGGWNKCKPMSTMSTAHIYSFAQGVRFQWPDLAACRLANTQFVMYLSSQR